MISMAGTCDQPGLRSITSFSVLGTPTATPPAMAYAENIPTRLRVESDGRRVTHGKPSTCVRKFSALSGILPPPLPNRWRSASGTTRYVGRLAEIDNEYGYAFDVV